MTRFSIEPRKYVKEYVFLLFMRNLSNKYGKKLLDIATKTGLEPLKTASKKVVHKAAEATGEFLGNKIADKVMKPKPLPAQNSGNDEEIVIPPEKQQEILNELRQVS